MKKKSAVFWCFHADYGLCPVLARHVVEGPACYAEVLYVEGQGKVSPKYINMEPDASTYETKAEALYAKEEDLYCRRNEIKEQLDANWKQITAVNTLIAQLRAEKNDHRLVKTGENE